MSLYRQISGLRRSARQPWNRIGARISNNELNSTSGQLTGVRSRLISGFPSSIERKLTSLLLPIGHSLVGYIIFKTFVSCHAARESGVIERIRIIDEVPYERLRVLYAMGGCRS
jgi:hypothetical protein